ESTSPTILLNELLLFLIGTSIAQLVNLYMTSREKAIQSYHLQVEENLKDNLQRCKNYQTRGHRRKQATRGQQIDNIL
nr:aromatic acid exporter family protein [Streptococcus oralis]